MSRSKGDTENFDLEKPNFCQLLNLYFSFYLLGNLIENDNFSGEIFAIYVGLPQSSVLAPLLYNIYTNDQPTDERTSRFIYADDLCMTSQESSFEAIERNLTDSLTLLTEYYVKNHLKPNASKTQVCAFHLRNREANRSLRVTWSGTSLEYHPNPLYLGVKLDRTLCYRSHILSTKAKVNTRNNILRKLTNSKWGCTPHTLRTSTLALCYTAAEYACPVWLRSVHASKLDPALNNACRTITGCLKPTNTSNLHLLAGIAPPEISRETASRAERLRQSTDQVTHYLDLSQHRRG